MSKFSKSLLLIALGALLAACTPSARINGTLESAPSAEVIVKLLDVNRYVILDTVSTDAAGKFSYKAEIQKGQPEFIYLFHKDTKVASLLLEAGDNVEVKADTLGHYEVSGSEQSVVLAQVEKSYADALMRMDAIMAKLESAGADEAASLKKQLGKEYVDYYRNCVKFVLNNSKSLTAVPVLYQNFGADLPVFGQSTDAIHFRNTADSLETVYPESKYVKALRKEADRRFGYLELETRLKEAQEVGYFDVELPDINAKKVKLSEVDAKVTMLYFWNPADAAQKMFNIDILKGIYDDFSRKGFEIYQVALTPDKVEWAQVVKQQNLPWISVCDGLGANSPYIASYNIPALPAIFLIADGELVDGGLTDEKALRKLLNDLLK